MPADRGRPPPKRERRPRQEAAHLGNITDSSTASYRPGGEWRKRPRRVKPDDSRLQFKPLADGADLGPQLRAATGYLASRRSR
jgi:hypothetical protein